MGKSTDIKRIEHLQQEQLDQLAIDHLSNLTEITPDKNHVADKTPSTFSIPDYLPSVS